MKLRFILSLIIVCLVICHGNHGKKKQKKEATITTTSTAAKDEHKHDHGHTHNHKHNHHDDINEHDHGHNHHDHHDNKTSSNIFTKYNQMAFTYLHEKLGNHSKLHQGYIGAFICSCAPIPIFIIMIIFKIKNVKALDILSAFAAGAILGDVLLHNLPEIYNDETEITSDCSYCAFFLRKEIILCLGVLFLFFVEKIMGLFSKEDKHDEGHSHTGNNLSLTIIGDFLHNLTDGLAMGAAFSKSKINFI